MNDLVSLRPPLSRQKRRLLAQPPRSLATLQRGEDVWQPHEVRIRFYMCELLRTSIISCAE